MVMPPLAIAEAARGMATIAAEARSESDRQALAYLALYACGYVGLETLERFRSLAAASIDTSFVRRLAEENSDRVRVSGWRITGCDERRVTMEREGLRAFVNRERFCGDATVGHLAAIELPAILPGQMPGFIVRHGARSSIGRPRSRLYLNIQATDAAWILGPLARRLDREDIAFEMKVLAHPRSFIRRDSAVVYLISEQVQEALSVVRHALAESSITLHPRVPLFTRLLSPGIGFADDPSDLGVADLSHGQWVSGLFTEAASANTSAEQIALVVTKLIREIGRDPDRPYLRALHPRAERTE
jgi:hypothetical protein